ncbi:unnamed protein product [Peronospora belbahrii]|uniref:Peptidase M13 C-terminal domain-containing protein n=1 Tax=Peronospora belbahrii TaxID=622444 RepID=A0AAU9L0K0_9STRA|nr:unnamed protein product [Peronospora belbahrii]CAH0514659.1 unnamed protein product [Peronospora belbahrii]
MVLITAEKYYAPDGKLQNCWSPDAAKASSHRADCFVKQYDSYAVTSATDKNKVLGHVNGELTLNENIADNGGIKLSFDAYQIFMVDQAKDLGKGSKARATGFTIPTSQAAYSSIPADVATSCSSSQQHSPGQWRVNGVAINSREFARVFSCPVGSPKSPKTECELW